MRKIAVSLLLGVALGGCHGTGEAPEEQLIDEQTAAYRGIALDDPRTEVIKRFGESRPRGGEPVTPRGRDHTEIDASPSFDCASHDPLPRENLRYEEVSFFLTGKRVCGWIVIEDGAATRRGVAIGDSLEDVETNYAETHCDTANEGTEYEQYPYCAGELGHGRHIWFGGDPINTIQMNTHPLD